MTTLDLTSATWCKSSYSNGGANGACVEVSLGVDCAGVRDTKDRAAGHFAVSPAAWGAFLGAVLNDTAR